MLRRASLRYLLRHPWQFGLSILGVALGVAVVVAIDLANASAQRAFTLSAESLSGPATHQISAGAGGLPESVYQALRLQLAARTSTPIIEGRAAAINLQGRSFQILGIDPLANPGAYPYFAQAQDRHAEGDTDFAAFFTRPNTGLLLQATAERLGLRAGDAIAVRIEGKLHTITIVGLLQPRDELSRQGLDNVIVTDIATAQELLNMAGRLSRIDLVIPASQAGAALLERIKAVLPAGAQVLSANTRAQALEQMTQAFRLNLTALSLLALLIGMFLIYNSMTFSVIQRHSLIGMLRAIGVTRREIARLILSEALVVALIGTGIGIVLGILLGQSLLHLVARTINDLYFTVTVRELILSPYSLTKGMLLGIGATLVAALWPVREAVTVVPHNLLSRSAGEQRFTRRIPRAALSGAALIMLSAALLLIPTNNLLLSFAALFGIMAGFALLVPAVVWVLIHLLQRLSGNTLGWLGKMSSRAITASLSRNGVAIAALAIAISATVGVGIMIESLRNTVVQWLEQSLRADIYVSPADTEGVQQPTLDPALVGRMASLSDVKMMSIGRRTTIDTPQGSTALFAVQVPYQGFQGFQLKEGETQTAWRLFAQQAAVIISEPYAYHHDLHAGDTLTLPTTRGPHAFPIAGVFYDYGSSQGIVIVQRSTYQQFWDDEKIGSLGIYLQPGSDINKVIDQLHQLAGSEPLQIRSNRMLREASITIFDRTFAITQVLRALTIFIAFVGILGSLMALQLERAKELAVLRAIGLTPRQLWGLVGAETGLMGLIAGVLALPLGLALALILILVVNRRSFGWTMQITIDPAMLINAIAFALIAALLAGIYPSFKMARTSPALALREE